MMMMTNPEDPMFENLLADYAAPLPDDGFSDNVFASIQANQTRTHRIKRWLLSGAVLLGGGIAALQVPAFIRLTSQISMPSLPLMEGIPAFTSLPYWAPFVLGVFVFMLWAILDNRGSEVI